MENFIIVMYLVILPIVTGFGIAFKEVDNEKLPNEYIPFLLVFVVGIPLAMLLKFQPVIAEPITQGMLMAFVGVFGHKVFKYINKKSE